MTETSQLIRHGDDTFSIIGTVNAHSVMPLYEQSLLQLNNKKSITFDFSRSLSSSSALVALLLHWYRYACEHHKVFTFKNLPQPILDIIEVSGLTTILPIQ